MSETTESDAKKCCVCGKEGEGLQRCGRCKAVWYCSVGCQKSHWPHHKERCPIMEFPEPSATVEARPYKSSGRVLFATRSFEPGDVIFAELAKVSAPFRKRRAVADTSSSPSLSTEGVVREAMHKAFGDKPWAGEPPERDSPSIWSLLYMVAAYADGTAETRSFVDSLAEPPNVPPSKSTLFKSLAKEIAALDPFVKARVGAEAVNKVMLRIDNNQHSCKSAKKVALFPTACIAAHSCAPNAAFSTTRDCAIVFRALRHIEKGDLVTTSYIDDLQVLLPTRRRRELLQRTKGFVCRCQRCLGPDRTRATVCPKCGTESVMPTGRLTEGHREDEKPFERDEAAKDIATTQYWVCQNAACGQKFYHAERPFSAEDTMLQRVAEIEEVVGTGVDGGSSPGKAVSANAVDPLKIVSDIDALRKSCREILGKSHWAWGQLTYSMMVQLQVAAMTHRSRELQLRMAEAAKEFSEWAAAAAPECVLVTANAQFFAGRMMERLELRDKAAELFRLCLPGFQAAWGPSNPDVVSIHEFLSGK